MSERPQATRKFVTIPTRRFDELRDAEERMKELERGINEIKRRTKSVWIQDLCRATLAADQGSEDGSGGRTQTVFYGGPREYLKRLDAADQGSEE